jgi:hypothetical protein
LEKQVAEFPESEKNNSSHAVGMERVDIFFIPQSLSRTTESFFHGFFLMILSENDSVIKSPALVFI